MAPAEEADARRRALQGARENARIRASGNNRGSAYIDGIVKRGM